MKKIIVLKTSINCDKCKTQVMTVVAKIVGVDHIAVKGEKGTVTVIGDADPVMVATQLRKKTKKFVEVMSVKAHKAKSPKHGGRFGNRSDDSDSDKKSKSRRVNPLPVCCKDCQLVRVVDLAAYDNSPPCTIL